jgi:hypothetical protein
MVVNCAKLLELLSRRGDTLIGPRVANGEGFSFLAIIIRDFTEQPLSFRPLPQPSSRAA